MACAACGQKMSSTPIETSSVRNYSNAILNNNEKSDCVYTVDQLKIWAQKLDCFKQRGLYIQYNVRPADLNRALGDVLSAINYPTYPCYYKKELDNAQNIIMIVISSGQC